MRNENQTKENSFPTLSQTVEYSLFFVAIFSLSQAAPLVRAAHAPAEVIGFWRLLGASLIMMIFCLWKEKHLWPLFYPLKLNNKVNSQSSKLDDLSELKTNPSSSISFITPKTLSKKPSIFTNFSLGFNFNSFKNYIPLIWIASSGVFFFLHLWTYFLAAQNTKIAILMVIFASNPLFTALLSKFFLQDKFHLRFAGSYILGLFSLIILFSDTNSNTFSINISNPEFWEQSFGKIMALLSAVGYSFYIFTGKKSRKYISNSHYTWMIYLICASCFGIIVLFRHSDIINYPLASWIAILGTILIPTLMGHALFSFLLGRLNINWMSCGKLVEPIFSSITAWLFFNESLQSKNYISFGLTFLSIIILIAPWKIKSNSLQKSTKS